MLLLVAIIGSVMLARTLKQEAAADDVDPEVLQEEAQDPELAEPEATSRNRHAQLFASILALVLQDASDGRMSAAMEQASSIPICRSFWLLAPLLFIIGVAGVLTRRNIIVIFMSIELILNAANLNFIAFSRYLQDTGSVNAVAGQIFTVFVIVVAAAEAAIGLGIVIALYRNKETIWVDEIDMMKW